MPFDPGIPENPGAKIGLWKEKNIHSLGGKQQENIFSAEKFLIMIM